MEGHVFEQEIFQGVFIVVSAPPWCTDVDWGLSSSGLALFGIFTILVEKVTILRSVVQLVVNPNAALNFS